MDIAIGVRHIAVEVAVLDKGIASLPPYMSLVAELVAPDIPADMAVAG